MLGSPASGATPAVARPRRHRIRNTIVAVVVLVGLVAGFLFLKPVGLGEVGGSHSPATTWADAKSRVAEIQAREAADPAILPACHTKLLDHGEPTANVVVLLHGYTNCPKQYDKLADELADRGYTVYVPRMPHHGEVPGASAVLDGLTAEEVAGYGDQAIDIANGLGDRVAVLGLSGGGLVASYIAQFRPEADLVIPIATFLGGASIPEWLTPAAINALGLLPPIDQWEAPPDAATRGLYPHGASDTTTHGALAYMRVGQTVLDAALQEPPRAGRVIVVINDADETVNRAMIETLAGRWEASAPEKTETYHFAADLGLLHDLLTPDRVGERVDVVYPVLLDLLSGT